MVLHPPFFSTTLWQCGQRLSPYSWNKPPNMTSSVPSGHAMVASWWLDAGALHCSHVCVLHLLHSPNPSVIVAGLMNVLHVGSAQYNAFGVDFSSCRSSNSVIVFVPSHVNLPLALSCCPQHMAIVLVSMLAWMVALKHFLQWRHSYSA